MSTTIAPATPTRSRPSFLDSTDTQVLGHTPELDRLRSDLADSYERWQDSQSPVTDLAERRRALEHELVNSTQPDKKTRGALRELNARVDELPEEAALFAGPFADALAAWAAYVLPEAATVRREAVSEQNRIAAAHRNATRDQFASEVAPLIRPLVAQERAAEALIHEVKRKLRSVYGTDRVRPNANAKSEHARLRERWTNGVRASIRERLRG